MFKLTASLFFFFIFFLTAGLFSYEISEYPYRSKYDAGFARVTDTNMILSSLEDKDNDVIFSALKRAGELRIYAAKARVEEIIAESDPEANQGKSVQRVDFKKLYDMGVLVLGKIGDANDAVMLSRLLKETSDNISLVCLLQALGDLNMSDTALQYLHQFASIVNNYSDYRVVKTLVDSIVSHKSKRSVGVLYELIDRAPQNLRDYIGGKIEELNQLPEQSSSASVK
jgi:hypothetical protein